MMCIWWIFNSALKWIKENTSYLRYGLINTMIAILRKTYWSISIVDQSIQSTNISINSIYLHRNLTRYGDNDKSNYFITACTIIQKMGFWCSAMQTLIERLLFILVFNWNTKNNLVEWRRRCLWSSTSQNGTEDYN